MHAPIPSEVEAERLKLELRLALLEAQDKGKNSFLGFSRYVWPEAIISSHHEKMASAFDRIADGTLKRFDNQHASQTHEIGILHLICFRHISWAREPSTKIIQATHTGETCRKVWQESQEPDGAGHLPTAF